MSTHKEPQTLLEEWSEDLHRQGKSRHTISAYRRGLVHFAEWGCHNHGSEFDLTRAIPRDVRDWKAYQQSVEQAAPASINQRLAAVSRFFQWAVGQGEAMSNPADGVPSVRLPVREPKALKEQDLRSLLREACRDVRDYAMLEVMVGTGVRVGELLTLQVGDVVIGDRSGKLIVRRGKDDVHRVIPLTLDVRKALEAYLHIHPEPDSPQSPLWWGQNGRLRNRSSVLRILEKYALRAGLPAVNPHALRHTFATRYLAANPGDLRGLARLLGHTNLNTVLVYTEPHMDDLAERLERMEYGAGS